MQFKELAKYFEKIELTTSRLQITEQLALLFKKLDKSEIKKTVYLLQGRLSPLYGGIDFGMAEKMVAKSATIGLNIDKQDFTKQYKKMGDLGKTVEYFKKQIVSMQEKELEIVEVYDLLYKLATASGEGSQEVKTQILSNLIFEADSLSSRYLVRIPTGILRLGFSDMTVLDAFSWMLTGDKKLRPAIEKAYHVRPDLGFIGEIIKNDGIEGLEKVKPAVFTPIIMMRAERLSSAKEIIEKIGKCIVESKYDGFRLQVHYKKISNIQYPISNINPKSKQKNQNLHQDKAEVKLYSRNLEEVSYMYPDIIEGVKKEIKADEVIFEGEAIGFDPNTGNFLPFQETVQRKRKYGIEEKAKEIPLKLFAFELLYLDGKSFINIPFEQRRKKLVSVIKPTGDLFKDILMTAQDEITDDEKRLELMFDDSISKGLEGIIAKKLDGIYQPGARGWNWIKFKRSYSAKIDDTIDCLVMGYDFGKGKRTGFGIGAFLVGVYDDQKDKFLTVAKIGTGLTDEEWKQLKIQSSKFKVQKKPAQYEVDKMMECDIWITPDIVVEIKADEITRSPVHTAGRRLKPSKSGSAYDVDIPGFALRFPRLVRFRSDKKPEDSTLLQELEKMFKTQGKAT